MTYLINHRGELIDMASGQEIPQDDPAYLAHRRAGGAVTIQRSSDSAAIQAYELADAKRFGKELVASFELAQLKRGINDNPTAALDLYKLLEPVRNALNGGLLHIAYAMIWEIMATNEEDRPAGASDADLLEVFNAIHERIYRGV